MEHRVCPVHKLKVLTYNIQVGISYTSYRHYLTRSWRHVLPFHGRQEILDSIARFISGFDIVGLQEVDAGSLRSGYINQAKQEMIRLAEDEYRVRREEEKSLEQQLRDRQQPEARSFRRGRTWAGIVSVCDEGTRARPDDYTTSSPSERTT